MNFTLSQLTEIITGIGALGTAAMGLLEALKGPFPIINWLGFPRIKRTVSALTPVAAPAAGAPSLNALPESGIVSNLKSNWVNGTDLTSQKAIAKSLIKLHLNTANAAQVAAATSVDGATLADVAKYQAAGIALTQQQSDVFARFDLIVTAMLDDCYQRSDQFYRNCMRGLAALIAVILALVGGRLAYGAGFHLHEIVLAALVGILATPLAPVAKDLSSALATAVNTMQLVKKVGAS